MSSLTAPHEEQPASEWASRTLSALDPVHGQVSGQSWQSSPRQNSAPESPGINMPGSFPKQGTAPYAQEDISDALKEHTQNTGQSSQEAALPSMEKRSLAPLSPEQGGASPHHDDTLPTQETSQNIHPSTSGGVGTLPGPPGETGVAVLPDERNGHGGVSVKQANVPAAKPSPIMTATNNNPVQAPPPRRRRSDSDPLSERHTGYVPATLQDDTSLAKLPEERRLAGLPSHDDESTSRLGKSGGAGALPGPANESGVALLPDERAKRPSEIGNGASADASIRTLPGSSQSYTPGPSPLAQSFGLSGPQTSGRDYAFSRDEERAFGPNAKSDLDKLDTAEVGQVPPSTGNPGNPAVGAGSAGLAGAGASAPSPLPKKSGFIDKVKGEIKILSGKMSHNESKIEEGRRMMGRN